jgi:hypothetical protein
MMIRSMLAFFGILRQGMIGRCGIAFAFMAS